MADETELPGGSAEVRSDIIFRDVEIDAGDRPALNAVDGVESVVRDWLMKLVHFRAEYLKGGKADAGPFIEKQADRMTAIFFGRDKDYAASPWNSPDQLGYGFGDRVGISGEAEEVMQTYWVQQAAAAFGIMAEHESDAITDDAAKFRIDALVEEAVYALLGLPLSAD